MRDRDGDRHGDREPTSNGNPLSPAHNDSHSLGCSAPAPLAQFPHHSGFVYCGLYKEPYRLVCDLIGFTPTPDGSAPTEARLLAKGFELHPSSFGEAVGL